MLDFALSVAGDDAPIALHDLPDLGHAPTAPVDPGADDDTRLLLELRAAHWNISLVARRLGVARMTLYRRMKRAGIVAPNHRELQ